MNLKTAQSLHQNAYSMITNVLLPQPNCKNRTDFRLEVTGSFNGLALHIQRTVDYCVGSLFSVSTRSKMKVGKCPYKQLEVSTFIAQVQKIGQANVSLLLLAK
jgi:hypothetical protein